MIELHSMINCNMTTKQNTIDCSFRLNRLQVQASLQGFVLLDEATQVYSRLVLQRMFWTRPGMVARR